MFKRPFASFAVLTLVLSAAAACSSNKGGGADGGSAGKGGTVTDASPDTGVFGVLCPLAPNMRLTTSAPMTAEQFCTVYLLACSGGNNPDGGYTTRADCEAAYAALNFDGTRQCRSYHVCNSANYDPSNAALHCGHAVGIVLCDDVSLDAGSG